MKKGYYTCKTCTGCEFEENSDCKKQMEPTTREELRRRMEYSKKHEIEKERFPILRHKKY